MIPGIFEMHSKSMKCDSILRTSIGMRRGTHYWPLTIFSNCLIIENIQVFVVLTSSYVECNLIFDISIITN